MGSETSVTALKALYQIETFLTSKIGSPGPGPACCWAAGLSRRRLVTTFCSGSSIMFPARILGESVVFSARISGESCDDESRRYDEDKAATDERERADGFHVGSQLPRNDSAMENAACMSREFRRSRYARRL